MVSRGLEVPADFFIMGSMQEGMTIVSVTGQQVLQPVVEAYFYDCKYQALGYASLGLSFVFASLASGLALYMRKSLSSLSRDLLTFSLIGGVAISSALLMVSTFKYIRYSTAVKSPVGAYELEHGPMHTHGQMLYIPPDGTVTSEASQP